MNGHDRLPDAEGRTRQNEFFHFLGCLFLFRLYSFILAACIWCCSPLSRSMEMCCNRHLVGTGWPLAWHLFDPSGKTADSLPIWNTSYTHTHIYTHTHAWKLEKMNQHCEKSLSHFLRRKGNRSFVLVPFLVMCRAVVYHPLLFSSSSSSYLSSFFYFHCPPLRQTCILAVCRKAKMDLNLKTRNIQHTHRRIVDTM